MKRVFLPAALIIYVAFPVMAQVEDDPSNFDLSVAAGVGMPTGNLQDYATTGPLVGGAIGLFANPHAAVGLEVNAERFGTQPVTQDLVTVTQELSAYQISVYGRYLLKPNRSTLFFKLMGGYFRGQTEITDVEVAIGKTAKQPTLDLPEVGSTEVSENIFMAQGLGYQITGLLGVHIFGEGLINVVMEDGSDSWFWSFRGGVATDF